MRFDRQDALTFAIGAGAAVAIQLGEALATLDSEPVSDWEEWGVKFGLGLLAALGRYLATRLPELLARPVS